MIKMDLWRTVIPTPYQKTGCALTSAWLPKKGRTYMRNLCRDAGAASASRVPGGAGVGLEGDELARRQPPVR